MSTYILISLLFVSIIIIIIFLSLTLTLSPAKSHSNRVVAFLLQKLEVSQEKVRLATLNAIKHLINSRDAELEDKKPLLISGLNIILHEQNLKVTVLMW